MTTPSTSPEKFHAATSVSLTVKDIQKSADWYQNVVGLGVERTYERDGRLVLVALRAGDVRINLNQDDGGKGWDRIKGLGFSLGFWTTEDIDAIASRIKASGGTLDSEPVDAPWGARFFRLTDPDGFKLSILKSLT
jgi:lactoylglutathione lyase